jgi:hypothetical protein
MAFLQQAFAAGTQTGRAVHIAERAANDEPATWPSETLEAFLLLMSGHGHSVSGTLMRFDRQYAMDQLSHAHTLADVELRELSMALFRHAELRDPPPLAD